MDLNQGVRRTTQTLISSISSHRILLYTALSTLAVSAAIANALKNYSNFYSVAIYLSKSSRSVLVLANFGFIITLFCGHITQQLFFGALRPQEIERLYDRLWFFITESLLAFTIFRDEFDIPFAMMFGFLLFVKSFHWLAADRVEWMEQRPYPGPPGLFHVRMSTLFVILWVTDCIMFLIAVENTLVNGVGGMVLFASEYAILMASILNATAKYFLSVYDLRLAGQRGGDNAPPWENKSMWVFYIELATDFLKLTTYLVFFALIMTFYGLPLNIIRDVYVTARSFITRVRALHRYQTATRNMDQRYPNATEAEMLAMTDRTCIICREEMILHQVHGAGPIPADTGSGHLPPRNGQGQLPHGNPQTDGPNTTPKKLPCGHIFHFHCLRAWLERQQSCPTCRRTVLETGPQPRPTGVARDMPVGVPRPPLPNDNNPLGFLGRVFGGAAPAIPGRFAQGQGGQHVHNAALPAGVQPQGVIIQYHIRYDVHRPPAQPRPPPLQRPARQLQPPPQFAGFHGPENAWQDWGMDRRWFANGAGNQEPPERTDDPPIVPPSAPSTSDATRTNSDSAIEGPSPREAAVRAALQRSGRRASDSSIPRQSVASPAPETTSSSSQNSYHSANDQYTVPILIPAPDYNHASPRVSPPQRGRSAPQRPPGPTNTARAPMARLPPVMTDEQLATMDRLTREAIDERLRVLEGVSGTLYRCIDQLMRMRSSLPASNSHNQTTAGTSTNPVLPVDPVPVDDMPSLASIATVNPAATVDMPLLENLELDDDANNAILLAQTTLEGIQAEEVSTAGTDVGATNPAPPPSPTPRINMEASVNNAEPARREDEHQEESP